jgi:ATP-dependent DNA helicase RecQ
LDSLTPTEILKKYWGYDTFRPLQQEIIQSVLDGHDTLALLPTGGGKSICFQVPALMLDGICIVVTPLIALMKDQVDQLNRRGIKALALYSGMSSREIDLGLDNCIYGQYRFLYVSPERLQTELFLARAEKMNISMMAVDEAHCISQWGYDFRPPYMQIADFREAAGVDKLLAVTATATRNVKQDIQEKLKMVEPKVFSKSFARFNLSYSVFETENKLDKMVQILTNVPGSSVVYVRSRKATREVAQYLQQRNISADYYHAGLGAEQRSNKQQQWVQNRVRVMVSTNAFGMGIDKPDVRTVIHLDLPDSLEAYYQEAGRAGRDERKAYAVLLFHQKDMIDLKERITHTTPSLDLIKRVYQALANRYKLAIGSGTNSRYDFDYSEFTKTFNLPGFETHYALKKLQSDGLIDLTEGYYQPSKAYMLLEHDELYKFQIAHASLDPIIKALLRLYGGELYSDFMVIREDELARFLKKGRAQVVTWLESLAHYNVIEYQKASNKVQITFLMPRFDKDSLPIESKQLAERRKINQEKADAMIGYASNEDQCRTRLLQAYFDELTDQNCGVCDFCVKRKKKTETITQSNLLDNIPSEGVSIDELVGTLKKDREAVLDAIRLLVEEGKISLINEHMIMRK